MDPPSIRLLLLLGGPYRNLPNPYVSGLQGKAISTTVPTADSFGFSATQNKWLPTTVSFPETSVGGDLSGTLPNQQLLVFEELELQPQYQLQIKY